MRIAYLSFCINIMQLHCQTKFALSFCKNNNDNNNYSINNNNNNSCDQKYRAGVQRGIINNFMANKGL